MKPLDTSDAVNIVVASRDTSTELLAILDHGPLDSARWPNVARIP